ncbi:MAG TPA: hypothetical protein VNT28_06765 [Candidatus Limnocylindrales bacterium]|jgi:hypothetical protein|nr:hypothetical protein [Candidatus Limnocylindrales bacterium]
MRTAVAFLSLTLLLAACGGLPGVSPGASPPDLTQPTPAEGEPTMPDHSLPPAGVVPQDLFAEMVEQAAAVAGVSIAEVSVDRAQAVTWSDGSLGCPEPGQMYTQALVDGYWVVLRAGGQEYDFRASQRGEVKLCPPGQGRPPIDS